MKFFYPRLIEPSSMTLLTDDQEIVHAILVKLHEADRTIRHKVGRYHLIQ